MSSQPNPQTEEARKVALVVKIIQKTQQGKIDWQRGSSSISALTPNGVQFDFILGAPILGPQTWVSFNVRDQNMEVLKVQKVPLLLGRSTGLERAIDALFSIAQGRVQDNVGRIMSKLDEF